MKLFKNGIGEEVSELRGDLLTNNKEPLSEGSSSPAAPDSQVPAKAKRRKISGPERVKILTDLDRLPRNERGAYMRQLGLYSGQVSLWRKKQLDGLSGKRGPKPKKTESLEKRLTELERENRKLKSKLKRADLVNELQKKIADVLGDSPTSPAEIDAED